MKSRAKSPRGQRSTLATLCACLALSGWGCFSDPQSLLRQGRVDEALEALRSTPDSYRSRYLRSLAYLADAQRKRVAGDLPAFDARLAEARKEAARVATLRPLEAATHNLLGMLAAYQVDVEGALRSFAIARDLSPEEPVFYLNLAQLEICRGDLEAAGAHIEDARARGSEPEMIQMMLGFRAWRLGDLDRARERVVPVLESSPRIASIWAGDRPLASFEDFTAHCEQLPFCIDTER